MSIEEIIKQLKIVVAQLRVLLTHAKLTIPNLPGPKAIVVHYDGAGNSFISVNEWHKEKWGFKSSLGFFCGYHYFIKFNGKIIQARADNEEGAHCVDSKRPGFWNKNSIGICLQGSNSKMTKEQKESLKKLLDRLKIKYNISYSDILGHKDVKPTVCPGSKIYNWLKWYKKQC